MKEYVQEWSTEIKESEKYIQMIDQGNLLNDKN